MPFGIFLAVVLLACAWGMWHTRYWAVLAFEAFLWFEVIVSALALVVASTWTAFALCIAGHRPQRLAGLEAHPRDGPHPGLRAPARLRTPSCCWITATSPFPRPCRRRWTPSPHGPARGSSPAAPSCCPTSSPAARTRPASCRCAGGGAARRAPRADALVIGAATPLVELLDGPVAELAPGLADAAASLGTPQVRNLATIGGNVMSALPLSQPAGRARRAGRRGAAERPRRRPPRPLPRLHRGARPDRPAPRARSCGRCASRSWTATRPT